MTKFFFLLAAIGIAVASLGLALDLHATIPVFHAAMIPAAVAAVAAQVDPIFVSVAAAAEILATSRSEIYQKLARGELEAVKDGARTKIRYESVKRVAATRIKLYVPAARKPQQQLPG